MDARDASGNHGYVSRVRNKPFEYLDLQLRRRIGDTSLGRYNKAPRMRIQKAENVNKALEFITSRGVKLTNIGPEGDNDLQFQCTTVETIVSPGFKISSMGI